VPTQKECAVNKECCMTQTSYC